MVRYLTHFVVWNHRAIETYLKKRKIKNFIACHCRIKNTGIKCKQTVAQQSAQKKKQVYNTKIEQKLVGPFKKYCNSASYSAPNNCTNSSKKCIREFFLLQLPTRRRKKIARYNTRFWSPKRQKKQKKLQKKFHPLRRLFKVFGRVFL